MFFKNIFMNYIKKSLVKKGIKGGIKVFRGIETLVRVLLLSTLDSLAGF